MRSVNTHQFSMVPRADVPRAQFRMEQAHKTTFDAGYLIPVYLEEVLPGDSFRVNMTAFARLATPIFPLMDNLYLESFFFFVPNRLVWSDFVRMMGEQDNPGDSVAWTVPKVSTPTNGFNPNTLGDYFGLPTVGQLAAGTSVLVSALPFRGYNLIWNEWFRDQNLQNSAPERKSSTQDPQDYALLRRGKRHDYFTSALPWPLKGGVSVPLPLGTSATVRMNATPLLNGAGNPVLWTNAANGSAATGVIGANGTGVGVFGGASPGVSQVYPSNLYADLSNATAATINQLRQSFQIQRLLERDARGGTRYTEMVQAHFGVRNPDARQQRPEYLGGGSTPITLTPVAQTSGTGLTGGTTPLANLSAVGTVSATRHGFSASFVEHGYVFGLVNVRADLTYQQGTRRHWFRETRYDFYHPVFANLGEQTILNREIYTRGDANDALVFGYQERWAEYRYTPSMTTGLFRSTTAGTLDAWHLAQRFTSLPVLGDSFIQDTPPLSRVLAVGAAANGQQIIFDSLFETVAARPMPLYSVPGMIDHF